MKIKMNFISLVANSMERSFSIEIMNDLANKLIDDYNLHQRIGIPDNIFIQKKDAAYQIVTDMNDYKLFPHLISLLVDFHFNWHTGRENPVHNIKKIINEIQNYGYIYDDENKLFIEDSSVQISQNWGVLFEGMEYVFTYLRIDIVNNSKLIRTYPEDVIESTYNDLYNIVENSVAKRNGRIWSWEGDGGLIAFHFSNKCKKATLSAMDILHQLYIYNKLYCMLDQPLEIRAAIHTGPSVYYNDSNEINKCESVKEAIYIESNHTSPNSVTISDTTRIFLEPFLTRQMTTIKVSNQKQFSKYQLKLDN